MDCTVLLMKRQSFWLSDSPVAPGPSGRRGAHAHSTRKRRTTLMGSGAPIFCGCHGLYSSKEFVGHGAGLFTYPGQISVWLKPIHWLPSVHIRDCSYLPLRIFIFVTPLFAFPFSQLIWATPFNNRVICRPTIRQLFISRKSCFLMIAWSYDF
jgi:hypothetical protein